MSYPDDREAPKSPFVGEGFDADPGLRVEPDYRHESGASVNDPTTVPVAGSGFGPAAETAKAEESEQRPGLPGARSGALTLPPTFDPVPAPSATELNNAFDDPAHGEPGRDRFRVHAIWEVVLLIAVAGMVIAVNEKSHLDGVGIRGILALVAVYAMFGVGAGWSLRAGAVNLALGPIAVSSGLYFAQQHQHHRAYLAVLMALGIAAGIGVLIALVVALLQVPGWAVSLAAFLGVDVWITHLPASVKVSGTPDIVAHAYYVFAVVAAVAIVGAAIGAVRPVRRAVGRFRPVSDPADRRGAPGAWMAAIGLVGSSVIAAGAGILYVMTTRTATTDSGLTWSVAAVAVALVGGTSLFGRRGGVLGTVLAAALFVLVTQYANLADYRVDPRALAGGALIVGVLVTRLIETYGRPRRSYIDEASTTGWLGGGVAGWANPAESHGTSSTGTEPPGLPERPRTEWVDPNDEAWGVR